MTSPTGIDPDQPNGSDEHHAGSVGPYVNPSDVRDEDMRNAALLVDPTRREFLADLDPLTVNSYAVLYARAEKWINYAQRQYAIHGREPGGEKWIRLLERWSVSMRWLDRNLIMSGSIRGRRADQLADVLGASRDPPGVGGTQVVVPQLYQAPPAQGKRTIWGR